jgi:hypothetical protein
MAAVCDPSKAAWAAVLILMSWKCLVPPAQLTSEVLGAAQAAAGSEVLAASRAPKIFCFGGGGGQPNTGGFGHLDRASAATPPPTCGASLARMVSLPAHTDRVRVQEAAELVAINV